MQHPVQPVQAGNLVGLFRMKPRSCLMPLSCFCKSNALMLLRIQPTPGTGIEHHSAVSALAAFQI
ncbi:hypothetical protein J9253_04135 [Thiothrix litoralis]|uniref:Uncharacterized protein n=1 Tax=Thiothrix litoralis TaxID=2891210 RepID=A0ABX7WTH3_9GAMM|nr:hypothetical protein [Thiothrix litoralis]QTR47139.1 hypothetical protein J9253_04135 [Thiothrix litoralis]